ncbi:MAG: class I SAM-dependent methyltransferase [Methanomassiliicoccales archaeon]|nr:class I SAM-dependent methyltransferase [Methanomassiliicoccales archaeon]
MPYYDSIHRETIDLVRSLERPPSTWLDTGCGTGALVELALDLFPNTQFILTDPSASMLEVARKRLGREGRAKIMEPMTTQELPSRVKGPFDVISAIQCHHYLSKDERARAIKACFDLLRPGGAFIVYENVRPLTPEGIAVGKRNWERFLVENGRTPEEAAAHGARFDTEYFPITVEEHFDLLRRAGFRTVEMLWCSYMQAGFYCLK